MRLAALLALLVALPVLAADKAPAPAAANKIEIKVTENGFEPKEIKVKKGQPTTLSFLRTTDRTCIKAVDIPAEKVKGLELPLNTAVTVTITPAKAGVEKFHCTAMAMGDGKIVVVD
jgi:plastocyanin domain-containing protein